MASGKTDGDMFAGIGSAWDSIDGVALRERNEENRVSILMGDFLWAVNNESIVSIQVERNHSNRHTMWLQSDM